MATGRSASMPSRLRQLLSGEGSIGPSIRLDAEPPPEIKSFIEKVIQSPLSDIAIPLSGFRWEYSKGNFHHWRPLFLHFDKYFKTFISTRNDLLLSDHILEDGSLSQVLCSSNSPCDADHSQNCPNKSSFDGLEHFKLLLASTDPEVLIAALETLSALVKISSSKLHRSGKLIGCGSVNSFLLSIAQGWGSKEEGLGLYSCVVANERNQEEGLSIFPSDLENNHKEADFRIGSTVYFELRGHSAQRIDDGSSSATSSSSSSSSSSRDDLVLMKECIEHYNVPPELRFSLLTRVRYAHAFRSSRICRSYSRICLLAFIVLVQSSDAQEELASFFANEPEYTNELIRIVRSEEPIPGTIRTLAMLALGAQLAVYSASHDRARILSRSSISFAVGNRMILLNVLQKAVLSLKISSDPSSIAFVEALLQFYLLHIVSSSSSGSTIRGSGMVPTFLPLLEYTDPSHLHLVYLAVKALQKLMDYSSSAVPLLRDLGGVELLSQRLELEVHHILKLTGENNSDMVVGESLELNGDQLLSRKRLIKVLLKSLGSSTYTPGNANRSQSSQESTLPATLSLIYRNADKFGGDIYYSAVTVMSDLIHKDPTSLTSLFEMGLPEAFLSSVVSGVLPSSKAIACIPNGLGAISLNSKGLETVKETSALRFLVDVFTSKKYVLAMNEAIVPFTNAVEELLRHVSSLRATGVETIIEIVDNIACFGESGSSSSSVSTAMEMDSDVKNINGVSHEQFVQLCIFHLIILLHRTMENAETSRLFVEKSGIGALLKLLLRPSIAQSSEGVSIALHSTIVFKGFTQHHSASLARAFCSSLRDQVKKALGGLQDLSGTFLLDRKLSPSCGIFSSLFLVEFLLFLAASKDNRWMTALLSEFANGSKDVLENIGHLHREILWHIAVYESGTLESPNTSPESEQTELSSNGTEGRRFSSFRQFLDPLFQRRTSGWSAESQFFDLTNLYRDLGRASTGFQPRPISDGPSSSSEASGNRELEREGSYYTSCCDMVKSLSFHITYIFQELGKAMLLQFRRREDTVNVSPSSKLVASSFASISLDHLNFEGHEIAAEASRSTKCLYLGKVVDFIDAVLLDRPDSCNPVLINCFYGRGVIQTVLTTFDATSQLLFSINRSYSSPMETDDVKGKQDEKEDTDHAWIYGPLAGYGKLMDHLVTSSFILSPFTKRLLVQPVENGNIPFPQDAETFVKILQSIVLKAVLPVWTHPLFTECSYDFVTALISIIKHVYSGVELKSLGGSGSARVTGPPPSETTISTIVEMGFSRSRAEEALRQVGSNSVEFAMEWLFSHPEEIQEDDELSRALAMSLGNSESDTKENVVDETREQIEAEIVSLPPVEELIATCTKLLQMKEPLAFPVRDLLVLICSENNGEHRSGGICCILSRIKDCCPVFDDTKNNLLSALLHVLALILHEDAGSREVALKAGTVRLVCDVLSKWDSGSIDKEKFNVPKWVTTGFLAIDRLLQVDQKLNTELIEELQKGETSLAIDESKQDKLQSVFGSSQLVDADDQKKLIEIACTCIRNQLPSETMHAVLQLCSTLTRKHSVAVCFLDFGGVQGLLSLPSNSLFPGFDSVAASIIRHVLEDPQTLQQVMESEIKHALATLSNRHSNQRISPRNFLLHVNSVIARDPVTFIQAARSICQVEMVGERPYIVLVKEKEKSKDKEKDKDKDKDRADKEKSQTSNEVATTTPPGSTKAKVYRKPPQSFIGVVELLLDSLCNFVPPKDDMVEGDSTSADMDIDHASTKGKGKAVATTPEEKKAISQDMSASLAKIVFILKLLSEMLLMYSSSIHIILRRDAEIKSLRGPQQKGGQVGGIFHHILHKFIPYSRVKKEKKSESDWRQKLASRANQFLVGASVRSAEARKRIFSDISSIFNDFIGTSNGLRPPANEIHILIDLLSDMLSARSPTGSHISSEASNTFVDVGLVKSLTRTLEVLDLDNVESPKTVTGIIKVLELVTKEHAHSADSNSKNENANKSSDQIQSGRGDTTADASEAGGILLRSNHDSMTADHAENFGGSHTFVGSEDVTDDMEHDQDLDEEFAAGGDDYMQEEPEDARGLENGIGSMGIEFEMHTHVQENLDEEDEEDEDDEDRVILRFEDGFNGLNVLDHLEVLRDHRFSDETLHVMPVEVFGSRRQGRTTSIYSLLGRTGDGATPSQHPLLSGSSSLPANNLLIDRFLLFVESTHDHTVGGRDSNGSSSSRLDAIFRSLRNGRQGHRLNLWADDSQQIVGSGASTVPQGLEDLLVSQLRRPGSDNPSDDQNPSPLEPQSQAESGQPQEATVRPEIPDENATDNGGANVSAPSIVSPVASATPDTRAPATDSVSSSRSQSVEMQYDPNDSTVRDVEAVSQESGGSGATLGESLRSLDVEIGSADGHDYGGERHDVQPAIRQEEQISSLYSVTEVPENSGHEAEQDNPPEEQPVNRNVASSSIDPAFLDALPEGLRAEVLSAQQAEVLAQQQAQRVHQSHELEGQPVEMDTVSIIATFPSELREEVLLTSDDAVKVSYLEMRDCFSRSAAKVIEAAGAPLVNTEALQAMIRVLRIVQPLYKGPLQRLLLNLCSHGETSNVTYSRPQHFDGVPPLVSRRVLETLTYLARNHIYVAKILLQSRLSLPSLQGSVPSDKARGKAVVVSDDHMSRTQQEPESVAFALLLSLLNQPLYLRSVAHLEQLLNLLEVIIDNAERKSESADGSDGSASEQQSTHQALEVENNSENHDMVSGTVPAGTVTKPIVSSGSSSNRAESGCDVHTVLLNLPQSELCLLCSLLAREGLSDNAYTLVAEVLKKLVAMAPSHCHLFITELANAIQSLTRSAISELHMFGEAVKTLLSTTSSDGSGVLRVLQALSSLVDSLLITKEKNSEEHVAVFSQLSNINLALEPLWLELSNCICKIEGHSDSASVTTTSPTTSMSSATTRGAGVSQSLPAGAQNMLPYVESFFVTCEKLHPSSQSCDISVPMASSDAEEQPKGPGPSSSSKVDEKYGSFIKFSERHRKLLNAFIRQNPALLEKSFSLMLKVPRFIEFDNKRAYFRSKIKHQHDHHHSPLRISVRRAYILEDSYNQLRMRSTQELKGRLTVHFQGEEGIDAGGLTREWYQLLSRVIFDKGALLFTTAGNDSTFQPNPNSVYQTEHLSYFKFVGRVVGKALFDGQLLDVHFTRSFYKHILGVKVTYHDIEAIDPDYYKALKWMLENDISDVLDLTFSVDADEEKLILYEKTEVTDHELIPGGRNIKVTEENKHEYVDLIAEHRSTTAIRPQINAFLEGFSELILKDLISIFNDKELELLISGLPDIDLDNLRANTEYSGYSPGSPVIQWFWEVVQGLSKEDKARLLQFVTGTSKVPLEGFSSLQGISGAQKFQIHKAYGSADHLPSAHTCFNQLDLPEYPSKEHLQERLLLAIHEASEGFGFG
ncbi:hypothetical protein Bca52824_059638 [Brassica carinata]|uniref:HECT-type E3 ubiquitin transferase n=1 Tax=Brassica carinata TaxID=52824 RepID=A0A8X7R003_BRACI|nr:hypothetical protein Bca52824_059638 [Brassica carinata]